MRINIKDRVDKLNISKNKLAQHLGISYPTMLDMYRGTSVSIRLDTLEKLCTILHCTPNDILMFEFDQKNQEDSTQTHDSLSPLIHHGIMGSLIKDMQDKHPDYSIVHINNLSKFLFDDKDNISWNLSEEKDGSWTATPYIKIPKELINNLKHNKSDTE